MRRVPWALLVIVGISALATPALAVFTNGNLAVTAAPVLAVGLVYLLFNVPLRYPLLVTIFLGLTLENPGDGFASGYWESPVHQIGQLFFMHWNLLIPLPPLIFSGVDFLLFLLFGIAFYRRVTHSRIDGPGMVEAASPLRYFCATTIFAALFMEAWGAVRGGIVLKYSLWQVQHAIYLPVFFFLAQVAFRGPQDHAAIGKTIFAAAIVRALAAVGIRTFVTPNSYELMSTATAHHDSLLFAGALCLCVALVFEMPSKKNLKLCILVVPILIAGMITNNRRLVWIEFVEALLLMYFLIPKGGWKRKIQRYGLVVFPVFVVYAAMGWDSQGGKLFSIARMMRSVIDSKTDRSTEWRDWENFDLIHTMKTSPVLGIGYGHGYTEFVPLDKVNYELEAYLPHNSVLGLWAYGGVVGFTLLWMMVAVTTFFAVRCYRRATRPVDRAAALACAMMVVVYMAHCYGDVGYGCWTSVFLMSTVLCVVGKLALTTGAWPSKSSDIPSGQGMVRPSLN